MTLRVAPGPLLSERTTLGLGGRTLAEITVGEPGDCDALWPAIEAAGGTPLVLGGGSNILAHDDPPPLCLVRLGREGGIAEVPGAAGDKVRVRAWCGSSLPRFLAFLAGRGLSGLSGLAGVPGTLGGAVAGNAGSYGQSLADVLAGVGAYVPGRGLVWFRPGEWSAGYRSFTLDGVTGFYLIVEVECDFDRTDPATVRTHMAETLARKKSAQPLRAASAGCVFKNPPAGSAGKLLDELGFRGKRLGGMAFSERHANFLVNLGGGTSREAFELIELGREAVRTAHNVELELEVRVAP